jgi:Tfp pilus assembly protein PilX
MTGSSNPVKNTQLERGAALITTVFVLLLITVLGMALTFIGTTALTVTTNDRQNTQAFYVAEAGAANAAKILLASSSSQFSTVLNAGDHQSNTGDELSVQPPGYSGPTFTAIPSSGVSFAGGTYKVYVKDDQNAPPSTTDSNSVVVITSVGTAADGSTATVEVTIGGSSLPAILANGTAIINGSPEIRGSAGAMFANGAITNTNKPCADLYIGSASTISKPANIKSGSSCSVDGDDRQNQPTMSVPTLNIPSFVNQSTYVLASNGKIYDGSTYSGHGAGWIGSSPWNGWSYNAGQQLWNNSSSTAPPTGTYYAEGSIKMSNSWGGALQTLTFIAEGYIDSSGAPVIQPALAGYTYVSGNDIVFTGGGGTSTNPGLIYAANQLKITNSPTFYGSMLIANINDNSDAGGTNLLSLGSNGVLNIPGSPTITYNGGGVLGSLKIQAWREVRN